MLPQTPSPLGRKIPHPHPRRLWRLHSAFGVTHCPGTNYEKSAPMQTSIVVMLSRGHMTNKCWPTCVVRQCYPTKICSVFKMLANNTCCCPAKCCRVSHDVWHNVGQQVMLDNKCWPTFVCRVSAALHTTTFCWTTICWRWRDQQTTMTLLHIPPSYKSSIFHLRGLLAPPLL